MTTERKPSERAVELKACPFCGERPSEAKFGWFEIKHAPECFIRSWQNDLRPVDFQSWNTRSPSIESELAAMLEAIVGELACHRSEHSHAIMDARRLLTTYHQRKGNQ